MPATATTQATKPQRAAPSAIKSGRILVRGVNWLGYAVMSTPALLRLREAYPTTDIVLLTNEKLGDLYRDHPAVDLTLTFGKDTNFWNLIRRLRGERFDTALVFPNSFRSAIEVFLAGIPRRIGLGGNGRGILFTEALPEREGVVPMRKPSPDEVKSLVNQQNPEPRAYPATAHHIHHYLHLAAALGARRDPIAPYIAVTEESIQRTLNRFGMRNNPDDPPLFGLNAGAEYGPAKRWPASNFVKAATEIQRLTHCRWLIFGVDADFELANRICSELDEARSSSRLPPELCPLNMAGKTSLRELSALMRCCQVVLTNDTGPAHVAAAVGAPVVVPYGSTTPALTGPGLPGDSKHQLLTNSAPCSPCFLRECPIDFRCMNSITVERVVDAVIAAFKGTH